MKHIYVILSQTGTALSRIIRGISYENAKRYFGL